MIITDYHVVFAQQAGTLNDRVADKLREGWQPLGGVAAAAVAGENTELYQTMVKTRERDALEQANRDLVQENKSLKFRLGGA